MIRVGSAFLPDSFAGRSLRERTRKGYGPTAVASRDLERYYALLAEARRRLRGRFGANELEALAFALQSMAEIEHPQLFVLAPESVEESVRYEELCAAGGIEDCADFLQRVRSLGVGELWALIDAVGIYLHLPDEERGAAGWKRLGLL
ncbi:hypothetical protein Mesil_3653 (plasmid) [Allomeiothermus silvanus DSM 9946]|uniref:Uncharacterized protein n=1 Tax=Allomeiothermus silvanus (strain ATCC 700542 / DSM 9946 / NBRC 106475 / NCIMB 13440 / VI-R2) TaxID=526227 RepID=D7BJT4_ALLS1|nr:hypothetical protein [Allomeiothermus silvanus]ADH65440.1 hypothetical protein Mesil_3653 [Allomeiothermus silvanus DSM 9946]